MNHEDISSALHLGFIDETELEFQKPFKIETEENQWLFCDFYNFKMINEWKLSWGKRKISVHLSPLNEKLAAEGKGIWVTIYAVDLYIVTIPITVKNVNLR